MAELRENKELIELAAKLELSGRAEVAAEMYLMYVQDLARLADGEDVLKLLYGSEVYADPPRRYAVALEWGFIARAAASLIEVVRARFPSSDWTVEPGSAKVDTAVSAFFTWLSTASLPRSEDFALISRMRNYLAKKDKVVLARSATASRKTLENAIKSVGNRKTRYEDGKLY